MRPAKRAMPGVEIQVCITRRANVGHVRRRRRPQPGPELRALRISGPGEQLEGTAQDGPAAHFVQLRVVAVQLRRAGNAQPLAQPREHELVLVVRHGNGVRARPIGHWQRHRVALERIDGEADAERAHEQRAVGPQADEVRIALEHLLGCVGARDSDARDASALCTEREDAPGAELHAALRRERSKALRELVRIARFVRRRPAAADHRDVAQCGLDLGAAARAHHLQVAAVLAHHARGLDRVAELALARIEMQDAAREMVILYAGFGAQLLQARAAVQAERHQLPDVVRRARGRALAQEREAPEPLREIGARPEKQRRLLAAEPLQDLARHARIGPRLRVRHRDLPAIGERGLQAGGIVPLEQRDLVAGLAEVPGGGNADDAGAENQDVHRSVEREAHLHRHLPVGHFALLDLAARLGHLEPAQVVQRL